MSSKWVDEGELSSKEIQIHTLLAVTNIQIRPPIIVQNRRNKHTLDTYACIIDLVPLVLEKTCFAGQIFEYKWKISKRRKN